MTHLEPGDIQSWIHREGDSAAERARHAAHLRSCADCRDAVDAADREDAWLRARLATLDDAMPRATALAARDHAPLRQAHLDTPRPHPTPLRPARTGFAISGTTWRIAATAVLMALGGSLVYAAPSARRWIAQRLLGALPPAPRATSPAPAPAPVPPNASRAGSVGGISVVPGADYMVLVESPEAVRLRVRSTRRPELSVATTGAHATFESRSGSMLVRANGPLLVDVEAPEGAARVVLRLNGRAAATVAAGRLARAGRVGQERLTDQWQEIVP